MNETEEPVNLDHMGEIGRRIKRVREKLARTQEEFAADLGVQRGAVGNWELDKRPSLESLYKIHKKTSVPMEWFMEGPDDLPIPGIDTPSQIIRVASDLSLTPDEAGSILTATFLALRAGIPEAEARVAARAVIRAYRTPPVPPKSSLSDSDRRSLVAEAIRLFLPE